MKVKRVFFFTEKFRILGFLISAFTFLWKANVYVFIYVCIFLNVFYIYEIIFYIIGVHMKWTSTYMLATKSNLQKRHSLAIGYIVESHSRRVIALITLSIMVGSVNAIKGCHWESAGYRTRFISLLDFSRSRVNQWLGRLRTRGEKYGFQWWSNK